MNQSIQTFSEHFSCIYSAIWSPHNANQLVSASGDKTVKLWDVKMGYSVQTIKAHNDEVLSVDWLKYQPGCIVTTSVDKTIKGWDLRYPQKELFM